MKNDLKNENDQENFFENFNADLENANVYALVNFLAVHDAKHLKFRVQKFESHSVFRIEEYIV